MPLFKDKEVFMEQLSIHGVNGLARLHSVTHGSIMYYKRKWDEDRKVKQPIIFTIIDNVVRATDCYGRTFIFDYEDLAKVSIFKWYVHQNYVKTMEGKKAILMHRFIMDCPDGMVVDHVNHDTFDNRKSNLRIATVSQNQMNQRVSSTNTSGVAGVVWHKQRSKWIARIEVGTKRISLGLHKDKNDAIKARKEAEEKYFGEFASK